MKMLAFVGKEIRAAVSRPRIHLCRHGRKATPSSPSPKMSLAEERWSLVAGRRNIVTETIRGRKEGKKEEEEEAAAVLWKCVLYLGRASDGHPKVPLLLLSQPSIHSAIKK